MALKSHNPQEKQRLQLSFLSLGQFHDILCCLLSSIGICAVQVQHIPPGADTSVDIRGELDLGPALRHLQSVGEEEMLLWFPAGLYRKPVLVTGMMWRQHCVEGKSISKSRVRLPRFQL